MLDTVLADESAVVFLVVIDVVLGSGDDSLRRKSKHQTVNAMSHDNSRHNHSVVVAHHERTTLCIKFNTKDDDMNTNMKDEHQQQRRGRRVK